MQQRAASGSSHRARRALPRLGSAILLTLLSIRATAQQPGLPPPGAESNSDFAIGLLGLTEVDQGPVVKGAPYRAEAITEMVRVLGDGNRITNRIKALVYRDAQGRTRREDTLAALGPMLPVRDPQPMILISDPIAHVNYVLDKETRVASRLPTGPPAGAGSVLPLREIPGLGRQHAAVTTGLGTRMVEGLKADGTRSVVTIPAGEIGNQKPIQIVSERWISTDLHVVVSSTRSDPIMGETTYRLTKVLRSDPDPSLFVVPPGYTIVDGPPGLRKFQKAP